MFPKVLLCLTALGLGVLLVYGGAQLRAGRALASFGDDVFYLPSGRPGVVEVRVRDRSGQPVPGLKVGLADGSGSWQAQTGADGCTTFKIKENTVRGLWVNDRLVARSYTFSRIDATQGLEFYCVLRDAAGGSLSRDSDAVSTTAGGPRAITASLLPTLRPSGVGMTEAESDAATFQPSQEASAASAAELPEDAHEALRQLIQNAHGNSSGRSGGGGSEPGDAMSNEASGTGSGIMQAREAMEALLQHWSPVGHSQAEVERRLGPPNVHTADSIAYAFDAGTFIWLYEFTLQDGHVVALLRGFAL